MNRAYVSVSDSVHSSSRAYVRTFASSVASGTIVVLYMSHILIRLSDGESVDFSNFVPILIFIPVSAVLIAFVHLCCGDISTSARVEGPTIA